MRCYFASQQGEKRRQCPRIGEHFHAVEAQNNKQIEVEPPADEDYLALHAARGHACIPTWASCLAQWLLRLPCSVFAPVVAQTGGRAATFQSRGAGVNHQLHIFSPHFIRQVRPLLFIKLSTLYVFNLSSLSYTAAKNTQFEHSTPLCVSGCKGRGRSRGCVGACPCGRPYARSKANPCNTRPARAYVACMLVHTPVARAGHAQNIYTPTKSRPMSLR